MTERFHSLLDLADRHDTAFALALLAALVCAVAAAAAWTTLDDRDKGAVQVPGVFRRLGRRGHVAAECLLAISAPVAFMAVQFAVSPDRDRDAVCMEAANALASEAPELSALQVNAGYSAFAARCDRDHLRQAMETSGPLKEGSQGSDTSASSLFR